MHAHTHTPHLCILHMQANNLDLLFYIIEQPVLHEHLITSSKAFGATSLSVIIGIKLDPVTLQPQSVEGKSNSSPCLYLVVDSIIEVSCCCRCWGKCLRLYIGSVGTLTKFLKSQLIQFVTFLTSTVKAHQCPFPRNSYLLSWNRSPTKHFCLVVKYSLFLSSFRATPMPNTLDVVSHPHKAWPKSMFSQTRSPKIDLVSLCPSIEVICVFLLWLRAWKKIFGRIYRCVEAK